MNFSASVVIPAYNAEKTLGACLAALQGQMVEVIVVDDGSADNTAAIAQSYGATLITLPHNRGRSVARNTGALAASGEILLFTDADCEPTPNWVAEMLKPFRHDPQVVGVKGAYYCKQREPIARFTQIELEDKYAKMAQQETISFIDTYSAAYRRAIFLANGGFDERLIYSLEDQDFSFRLAGRGYKMVFTPHARVYHQHITRPYSYYQRKWTVGKWKTVILRRHPLRRDHDSRTPLTLKFQFGLAAVLTGILPVALFVRPLWKVVQLILGLFVVTTLPFHWRTARRDPLLLPLILPLLLLRAFGLAHGYLDGLMRLRNWE
jgi:glycosyltransferase involved in cell wall biosynthesis